MNKYQHLPNSLKLAGTILGGLIIGLPAISHTAIAQQSTPKINPCPRIFYQEPHNSRVMVPQGCPPNAFTQKMGMQGNTPLPNNNSATPTSDQTRQGVGGEVQNGSNTTPQSSNSSSQSPMQNNSESTSPNYSNRRNTQSSVNQTTPQQRAIALVAPVNGRVSVRLVNNTAANITYQAIGDTAPRMLAGKSEVTLQGLRTPATVTFNRQDGGLLMVTPQSSQEGILQLSLRETTDLAIDKGALRIEQNGSVYLN